MQQSGFNSLLMSETLICSKGFQLFSTPGPGSWIQKSVTVETVKQHGVDMGMSLSIARVIEDISLFSSTAHSNSDLGIV